MLRRLTLIGGICAVLATLISVPATAAAPAAHAKRVCPVSTSPNFAQCFSWVVTDANGRALVSPNVSGYGPAEFHTGYNLPTTALSNQTIAIVDAYSNPNVFADLKVFNSQFGLPTFPKCTRSITTSCISILNQFGKKKPLPVGNTEWGLEIALDVQVAHEICQNCRILLFEANSNSFADLETAVNTAASKGANVISNSYGAYLLDCNHSAYNHPNVAVTVSAGDSGFGVACPAVGNTTVAVGGTTLNLNGNLTYNSETVWNGTGSGCSHLAGNVARSWQTTATNWAAIACGTFRGMTDVSADADPNTGAAVYDSYGFGGWLRVGGTSLSAPLIGAVYALAGNASSFSYPAQTAYLSPGSLHDVTSGSNGSCATHPLQCNAGSGYDLPTGIGTPNGLGGF
jgi:subtilase family serine protease